jgi:pimeloyl-ACP methyl ester carboxylesterase
MILALSIVSYWLGYHRYSKKILERPESPLLVRRIPDMMAGKFIDRIFLQNGTQRGTFHFVRQINGRSSKHRILMALYTAIGTALALSSLFVIDADSSARYPFKLSSTGSLEASLILTFVIIAGLRATFNVSSDINANWIFRTAGGARPESYRSATQKWVFLYRITPLFVVLAVFDFYVFPPSTAFCHLMFDLSWAALLFEAFFLNFNKIPFTCAYVPKKLQLVVMAAAYLYGFTIYVQIAGGLKAFVAATPALDLARSGRMAVFLSVATILFIVLRQYRRKAPITFGDSESPLLDISSDSAYWSPPYVVHGTTVAPSRSIKTKLVRFLALVSAAALLGVGFEQVGRYLDRRAYPQIGQSFDVGGRSLNISCLGTGNPTVLLESDFAVAGYSWLTTQREIERFANVCWYDRAGYGWSDPGPFPNHSDSVARDLHNLLAAAHISPPYVLVGHGMGAFHVRVYNGLYPDDTSGMVLVDPMNEDTTIQVHNHNEALRPAMIEFAKTLGFLGLLRLIAPSPGVTPNHGWTQAEWNTAIAMAWQPRSAVAHIHEPPLWISGELARTAGDLRHLPLIVLSGERHASLFRGQNVQLELDRHKALSRRSTRGRHTIVANSGYWNPYKRSEPVVDAVRYVVLELRSYSQP